MKKIYYKKGYKYQLAKIYTCQTNICPPKAIFSRYIDLDRSGLLTIYWGYAWDGPSGPTIDTKEFLEGSLVHDALYQLIRMGLLEPEWRIVADQMFKKICKEKCKKRKVNILRKGINYFRIWYMHQSVKYFAGYAADPKNKKEILEA